MKIKFTFLAFTLAALLPSPSAEPALKVGAPAPPLTAAKWFKGQPVNAFDSN